MDVQGFQVSVARFDKQTRASLALYSLHHLIRLLADVIDRAYMITDTPR